MGGNGMLATRGSGKRVAVVGTGIAGLSAAWLLAQDHDLTVFEAADRVGGHALTEDVPVGGGAVPVDMGFIVYNTPCYPNLCALFEHLEVETQPTDMSLAVSLDGGRLEYGGGTLGQLFAQKRNAMRPRFWRMLSDLLRFYRTAPRHLPQLAQSDLSLGQYLDDNNYGPAFREDHLLPMAAAIWSVPTAQILSYPAYAFLRFHDNHGLLQVTGRPIWRTVTGGSRSYVSRLVAGFEDRVRMRARVVGIRSSPDGVCVTCSDGHSDVFDDVVLATHADEALAMLDQPTAEEASLLGTWQYSVNTAVLHSDERAMPCRRRAWASWNYIGQSRSSTDAHAPAEPGLTVTYWMNRLQALPEDAQLFVTLNPNCELDPKRIFRTETFTHPVMDGAALRAQKNLWRLQGQRNIWYCGAYFGAGFHEDGLQAGLAVAEAISGRRRPWTIEGESDRIVLAPIAHDRSAEIRVPA